MYFFGKKGLIDVKEEGSDYLYGNLKESGHFIRVRPGIVKEDSPLYFEVTFGKKSTFDRWSNSDDLTIDIIIRDDKKMMEDNTNEAINMAIDLFKKIPNKYFNRFLTLTYSI